MRITTCQAPNSDHIVLGLHEYLKDQLRKPLELVIDMPWQDRAKMLYDGEIDIAWICGLPYTRHTDAGTAAYELLATPARNAKRYLNRPVFFSDVVIRADSDAQVLTDLRGATVAYNEPESFSGYTALRAHIASIDEHELFGKVYEAGSHEEALELIKTSVVDVAAIDSTVLEMQEAINPSSVRGLKVLHSLGPYPGPPLVISKRLPKSIRETIRTAVLNMHNNSLGRQLLEQGMLSRFMEVNDNDYDIIRNLDQVSRRVTDWSHRTHMNNLPSLNELEWGGSNN